MMVQTKIATAGVRKYVGLQIVRIAAAFMVLVTHSTYYASERLDHHFRVWETGAGGVDVFFALSGFVMIYSSMKLLGDPNGWKIFAGRRIVRIVPIYWIATTIKVLALFFAAGYVLHARFNLAQTVESYLFLPARDTEGSIGPVLSVGWTLNFEMFFYFLFTLALFWRTNVYKFIGISLGLLTLGSFFRHSDWPAVSFYLNSRVLEFFYGMVIAKLCLANKCFPIKLAIPLLIVGFAGLLFPWPFSIPLYSIALGLSAALILYSVASLEDVLTRIPRSILYLADASYAIYLFHPLIAPSVPAVLLKLHLVYPWLSVACSVCAGLAGGCLIHSFVEDPLTKWFQRHVLIGNKKVIHDVATAGSVTK